MIDAFFWKVHSGLKREGPGDEESLRSALAMMADLPVNAHILDVGCGPGAQSLELAELGFKSITAVDTHQEFLDDLNRSATQKGIADRIRTVNASMTNMPFANCSFDAIWSEGAMYMMGFREGLSAWKRFLKPRGYIAVTEPCWLKPERKIPGYVRKEWEEYPSITTIENILARVAESGYREIGHFVLPPSAWWTYYAPMEERIKTLRDQYHGDPAALARLEQIQSEIEGYRNFGDYYSYLFVVMQLL